jgi:hypothetical protein
MHRRTAVLHGLSFAGLLVLTYVFLFVAGYQKAAGYDAYAYWSVDLSDLYGRSMGNDDALGAWRYSPAMAQAFSLFKLLPWWNFLWLWIAANVATLIWLGGRWTLALLAFPLVAVELYLGNIHLFLAAAIVLGFRYPWAWSFLLLTKVTPGVALVWFVVRREWRNLAVALGTTAVIVSASALIAPHLWWQWFEMLADNNATANATLLGIPLLVRVPVAIGVVAWAARTDRRWIVPLGVTLAMPVLWWTQLVPAIAAVTLLRAQDGEDRAVAQRLDALRSTLSRGRPVRGLAPQ